MITVVPDRMVTGSITILSDVIILNLREINFDIAL